MSPFNCVFGYQPPVFSESEPEVSVPSAHALVRRCRRIWAAARQTLIRQGDRVKRAADRRRRPAPAYQPGQRVWLAAKELPLQVKSRKLAPCFVGPFPISRIINPAAVRLRLPRSLRVHPTFHVSKIKPVKESAMLPATKPPPSPRMVGGGAPRGGPVYAVKRLLAVRNRGWGRQFLVDWEGYGPEERQWVPARFIMDPDLIRDFYKEHPDIPGPSGIRPWGWGGGGVMSHRLCQVKFLSCLLVCFCDFLFYFGNELSSRFRFLALPHATCHQSDWLP